MAVDPAAEKIAAARRSLQFVAPGMVVGLGSGSTAAEFVRQLGAQVRSGLAIRGVPSSTPTRRLAEAEGIPLTDLQAIEALDLTIDGADEIDPRGNMIKGRGGALLHEKILAVHSRRLVIAVDSRKRVPVLGMQTPIPIEVIPLARPALMRALARPEPGSGARAVSVVWRSNADGTPFVSDEGNHILDCDFGRLTDPAALAARLDAMVGVVEHGLFLGLAPTLVVGDEIVPLEQP